MDAPSSSSSLKRELESGGSTNSPSPSKKRQPSETPLKSATLKRAKSDSEEQLSEPTEQEALVDEVGHFGEDPEEDPDEEVEFIADGDVLEDEAVLAQVLGVDVISTSAGPTTAEQQEETNRAEDRKLLALMAHFNEDQLSRFEAFRRATFTKSAVNRIISSVSQTTFSPNVVIAMSGITKVFVGELVEEALDYKQQLHETGPLLPKHIRVAYDRLRMKDRTSRANRHYKVF
nr:Transcription initiation factor TFIID subunit [Hymenolepis microstoma]